MRRFLLLVIFFLFAQLSFAQQEKIEISAPIQASLDRALALMNVSNYDSAQYIISGIMTQSELTITPTEMYIMRCFEAEILYYNALFEQGLNTMLWGLDLAKELNNPRYIGNSHNFIGLFMMNLGRHQEAIYHFKQAAEFISPNETNDYLSQKYHAYGNLGECYLKLNEPDSAIIYSLKSLEEASTKKKERGIALAQYNIAEAEILKGNLTKAASIAKEGYNYISNTQHRDVVQYFCATLMKIYTLDNKSDSVNYWLNLGLEENKNPFNTDLSRLTYLQSSFDAAVSLNQLALAQQFLREINSLQQFLNNKQQTQRISILKDYYEKNNRLALAAQESEIQSSKLKLRSGIIVTLGIVAALLLILFLIFRKNSLQKQHITLLQQKEEMFRERNRIASDLHDDIGAALSSIRIYSGAAQNQLNANLTETAKLIERINSSSSGMMERMSDIVWSINPKDDSFESIILRMKTFATELLASASISVLYDIDHSVSSAKASALLKRNLYLIFKESINNTVKYSGATKVKVSLKINNKQLILTIEDNGKGFEYSKIEKGNGLINMNVRTQALHGHCEIISAIEEGTTIKISIPMTKISDVV